MCLDEDMSSTAQKFDTIKTLAIEAGWIDQTRNEELAARVDRMWNRGAMTDALTELTDSYRAERGLAPAADCTQRLSYRDPRHGDHIWVQVEILDGKIRHAEVVEFGVAITSLTGIIRFLENEANLAKYR